VIFGHGISESGRESRCSRLEKEDNKGTLEEIHQDEECKE
jgi:hypothetical protein